MVPPEVDLGGPTPLLSSSYKNSSDNRRFCKRGLPVRMDLSCAEMLHFIAQIVQPGVPIQFHL
jgi:hypothetical protein